MITAPTTVTELAALLGVSRRRISKWRAVGAPDSLDLAAWRVFLKDAGKTKILARLDDGVAPLAGPAPETAGAATGSTDAASDDSGVPEVPKPDKDAGAAAWEKYFGATAKRQRLINERRQTLKDDRELIPVAEVHQLLIAMGAAQLEALGDTIWLALRPHLDGVADTLRKTLRTTHDQAVLTVRTRVAALIRDKFTAITNPPAKPD